MPSGANTSQSAVDKAVVAELLHDIGDAALRRLVGIFIEECERNCREIKCFLSDDNFTGSEIVAHRFKSAARQFGADGLAEICQELEHACAGGQSDEAGDLFDRLIRLTPPVLANLDRIAAAIFKDG